MPVQKFKNGATIITGDDIWGFFLNKRNNYKVECRFCRHEDNEEHCEGCSIEQGLSCSCHICPPCTKCVDSKFERTDFLINFKVYQKNNRTVWECFKSNEAICDKYKKLEDCGYCITCEILTTGEITIYLEKEGEEEDIEIEICKKYEFKKIVEGIIIKQEEKGI